MHSFPIRLLVGSAIFALALATPAAAETITDTKGDTEYESVYYGYGGAGRENLSALLAGYVNPLTSLPDPILSLDGDPLVVGNVEMGEVPSASDQTQIQRFYTTTDQQYRLTYLGLGEAAYLNVLGVYVYDAAAIGPADFDYDPLVTQNVTPAGTDVLFSVPADHHFGFYLSADGGRRERNRFFSENDYNPDAGKTPTDHVLMFETSRGLLLAWEDLPLGYDEDADWKLGDQDYEDLVGALLTYDDPPPPVPEPATMALLGAGFGALALRMTRHGRKKE